MRAAARLGHPLRVEQQAVGHVHHRVGVRRERLAGAEQRDRAAVDVDQRARRVAVVPQLREAGRGIADRADQPQTIAGLAAGAVGHVRAGAADRGQAEHPRRAVRKAIVSPPISGRP